MNIGVDGSYAILKNNTTEGIYTTTLIDAIAKANPRNRIYVYTPYIESRSAATKIAVQPNVDVKRPKKTWFKSLWLVWKGILKELKRHHVHVYHGVAGRLPLSIRKSHARAVVTIHSLAHKQYPQDYGWWERTKRNFFARKSCQLAHAIVVTSEHMRDDLVHAMDVDRERVHVIYPAVDRRFDSEPVPAELASVRSKYKLPQRYILVNSSLLEHKNVMAVLQAMQQMQDHSISLVLVGVETDYYRQTLFPYAQNNHLKHRLMHITRAHGGDMAAIYRMANVVVAPSRCEGFGLTVIEAQACGVPVITTAGTSLQEAAGEGALLFDPDDTATLASHLDHVLTDEALRQRLIEAGEQNVQRFTPERMADALDTLYHSILKKH